MKRSLITAHCLLLTVLLSAPCSMLYALTIESGPASNVTRIAADVYGNLSATNGTTNTVNVLLYYGTTDSTTNAGSWGFSNAYGTVAGTGILATNLSSLTPATRYYYRWYVYEGTNTDWASTSNFTTTAGAPTNQPAVSNVALMVSSNGTLKSPTNFFGANGVAMDSEIALLVHSWTAGTGMTNSGTATNPTGALNAASVASLALADSATQPGDDWTNTIASMSANDVTNGAARGATALQSWIAGTGMTNSGTATAPTGSLDAASVASLALADSATQPGDDWTNTIASMSADNVTNGAALGATALQAEADTLQTVLDRGADATNKITMTGTGGASLQILNGTTYGGVIESAGEADFFMLNGPSSGDYAILGGGSWPLSARKGLAEYAGAFFSTNNSDGAVFLSGSNYSVIATNKPILSTSGLDLGAVGTVSNGFLNIDSSNLSTNTVGGKLTILGDKVQSGNGSSAVGVSSHAEGRSSTASGIFSHAEGDATLASGEYSHAEGRQTTASGNFASHAEGNVTVASGDSAHAEGHVTLASGGGSHAEGGSTVASGAYSHAEGYETQATGMFSHAEGRATIAGGDYSHSAGQNMSVLSSNSYGWSDGTPATNNTPSNYMVVARSIDFYSPAIRTHGTNYIYYADSTNYVAMWADVSAYYIQAVSNGTAAAVKTNALW